MMNARPTPQVIPLAALASLVVATSAVAILASRRKTSRPSSNKPSLSWRTSLFPTTTYWLCHFRVPIANLTAAGVPGEQHDVEADDEGLVECSIQIKSGRIESIVLKGDNVEQEAIRSSSSSWFSRLCRPFQGAIVQGHGCIVLPRFSDAHTHLVKTQTVPRNRNYTGTMGEALLVEACDQKQRWGEDGHVLRLMDFAIRCALHHGTRAMRTHLDGCAAMAEDDTVVREAVWNAFDTLSNKYKDHVILQGVANLWLPLWLLPMAKHHADRASQHDNVVLGAYVGNPSHEDEVDTIAAMDALFGHAQRLGMDCDLHMDESNDPACCALLSLCKSLSKARAAGYKGKVVLGHCCALSLQEKSQQDYICAQLASLNAYVVANPFTNLGLQDRSGSKPPHGTSIPKDIPRTPQWRGLTLLQELRAAGVVVAASSDNVRDHWYPYGDFDLLSVWAMVQAMGHLDTAPCEGKWADVCTDAPSQAMGIDFGLVPGAPADLVLFPSARRASELFARPQTDRIVIRNGKQQHYRLPEFSELDDLVEDKTERIVPEGFNEQSAS